MTFFHFGNCVALACAPYFITYKYSGLAEYSSVWKCVQAAGAFFVTQLCKLLMLATFFPAVEHEGERFYAPMEFLKSSADILDLVGLHLIIMRGLSGKGEVRFLAGALGWAAAELLATLFLPLWVGARGMEFDWKYVQMSLEANFNLIHYMSLGTIVWLRTRSIPQRSIRHVILVLLAYAVYRPFLFLFLEHAIQITSWPLLGVKALLAVGVAVLTMQLYAVSTRTSAN